MQKHLFIVQEVPAFRDFRIRDPPFRDLVSGTKFVKSPPFRDLKKNCKKKKIGDFFLEN